MSPLEIRRCTLPNFPDIEAQLFELPDTLTPDLEYQFRYLLRYVKVGTDEDVAPRAKFGYVNWPDIFSEPDYYEMMYNMLVQSSSE